MEEEQYEYDIDEHIAKLKKEEEQLIKEALDGILDIFSRWMKIGMMYYGNHKLMLYIDDKPIPLADYMKAQRENR